LSALTKISEHVYWLPPGPPDRPSLCAVVGTRRTAWLDAGSSAAHSLSFLGALAAEGVGLPSYVVLTHSHWDHVFGAAALDASVIAHRLTAATLVELAAMDWSDEALDRRVAAGEAGPAHAANVKEELPAPREVRVTPADVVFEEGLDLELGSVTVRARHVGGDHAADSCVMFVEPDRVLFLGDCLYERPDGGITSERAQPLHAQVLAFDAELFVEGHGETVLSRADVARLLGELRESIEGGTADTAGEEL
jgi:glyoxylase-like metal-dependent hydrolase (beta-lactamase superfamily II)